MSTTAQTTLPAKNLRRLATYLEPEIYEALERLAKSDKRTMSQMAAIAIEYFIQSKNNSNA